MFKETKIGLLAVCAAFAALFWWLPLPQGVAPQGLHLLGIFIATILGIVLRVMPMGAVALLGITTAVLSQSLEFSQAFSGFNHPVVWLIVTAFFIAKGFTKTGLGNRIAYLFVWRFGKKTLGLSYSLLTTELILAPAIPSNTARSGGVIFPILDSLSKSFGSDPKLGTAQRMGAFLVLVAVQGTAITGSMFLTSMSGNPLIASFALEQGVEISWGTWCLAAIVPGLISLFLMPLIIYKLYPPSVKETPHAPELARSKLHEMGKMRGAEWTMLITFLALLAFWVFGKAIGISPTAAALGGLCALLILGVLDWKEDLLGAHKAWETLFWFAALIAMASSLSQFGVIEWIGGIVSSLVVGLGWPATVIILSLSYFFMHYLFASLLAHIAVMYPIFLAVAISSGAPPLPSALLFGFLSNLYGAITHYASGPAAVLYAPRYVPLGKWWKFGFLIAVINLIIWIGVGSVWWKVLGLW